MIRKNVLILFGLLLGCQFFWACLGTGSDSKKITGLKGIIEVTVPSSWQETPGMHRSADIQAGDEKNNQYLLVVSELKTKLKFPNKEAYSKFTRDPLIKRLGEGFVYGPDKMSIYGHPAIRYEIRGRSPNHNSVVYYHTVVESPRYFHQIVLWTSEKNFKANGPGLIKIMESFREN